MSGNTIRNSQSRLAARLIISLMIAGVCFLSVGPVAAMTKISNCPESLDHEIQQLYINYLTSTGEGGACDSTCQRNLDILNKRACQVASQGYCYECDPDVCTKYGITCKAVAAKPTASPPPDDSGTGWVVVVGVLAAAGVGAAVVLKGKGRDTDTGPKTQEKQEEKEKKKSPVKYILQVTPSDKITVSPKEKGGFTVTAWKVDEQGVPHRADDAAITLIPPAEVQGLSVSPLSGAGSVSVSVSLGQPAGAQSAKIKVTASAGGKTVSTFVTVSFKAESNIEFD